MKLAILPVNGIVVVAPVLSSFAVLKLDLKDGQVNAAEGDKANNEHCQESSEETSLCVDFVRVEVPDHVLSVVNAEDPNERRNLGDQESEERNCARVIVGKLISVDEVTIFILIV